MARSNLAVVPNGLVSFGVNVIRIHGDVGELSPEAFSFDFLKGSFTNEVGRLVKNRSKQTFIPNLVTARANESREQLMCAMMDGYLVQFDEIIQTRLQRIGVTVHL